MFEEASAKSTNPPGNLPVEPVDVLAAVEHDPAAGAQNNKLPDAMSAGLLKPKSSLAETMPMGGMPMATTSSPGKKLLLLGLAVIVVAGGAGAAWYFLMAKQPSQPTVVAPTAPEPIKNEPATPASAPVAPTIPEPTTTTIVPAEPAPLEVAVDTDQDGLTDTRELELGLDAKNPDTDGDGLSDGDEVQVWKTDPKNPDTDGDKFPDGTEIKNGYSPTGPGKLFAPSSSTPVAPASNASTAVTP